ncbi:MAG: twitching motility protein PilT [Candidatus Sumerlaeota bacterium]|nr:twitching motility protein PilT [Candidatus Sumerlaeota bacterium]
MGLFSSKKPESDNNPRPQGPSGSQPPAAPPRPPQAPPANPLAPPSAQKKTSGLTRLPESAPSGRGSSSTPGSGARPKGPTPPGGLLPTPDWHNDFETEQALPPTRPSEPPPRPGTQPAQSPESGTNPTVALPSEQRGPSGTRERIPRMEIPAPGELPPLPVLLREAVERGASDLHLTRAIPPTIRLDGYLIPLDYPPLTKETCERLCTSSLNTLQRAKFQEELELDFSLDLPEAGRFRVNLHRQRGGVEGAFRVVNEVILPLRRLGLPGVVEEIGRRHQGLVLVTGPTGSGKSTTMASIVDQINNERQCMIITIEDPIEYVHRNKRSIVKQREVASDTRGFGAALRHVLRQDPDVIVIGEMRDLETISTALMAAETGHLVFTTLHTPDAMQTVDRMIDVFPPHQQEQVRIQVANTIQAIIAQQLIPVPGNRGRVVAVEILVATTAVRKIIRTGKTEQLFTAMQTSWEQGMITMDKSLKTLYQQGLISFDDAISRCRFPSEFDNI